MRILVSEPLAEEGLALLRKEADVDFRPGLERQELLRLVADADALVVRSATKVDEELIESAPNLKVIGRAGTGVDNVDVEAATRRGITVVNAPQSNILSAAEHAIALLLAVNRHIPAADAALRRGEWDRERFTGVELHGKQLGIIGLGRIGTLVAQRASAFGMKVLAYDSMVSRTRAEQMGIELVPTLDELCRQADFISVHLPKTGETTGIIGEREISLMKQGVGIINISRGGIVDEAALVAGLKSGQVGAAGLDVFENEPPGDHPLFRLPGVVATPHIAGQTEEAQKKAGTAIAEQVALALKGEFVPYAVNLQAGTEFVEALRPFIPLTELLGRTAFGLVESGISSIQFEFRGTIAESETRILTLAGLTGVFSGAVQEPVTYVNAPILAEERGIEVGETRSARSPDFVDLVTLNIETETGPITVGGTLAGKKAEQRLVRIYDYEIDMEPARFMCFLRYEDRPGIIGQVGTVLGEAKINIAGMHVSRENIGGEALMGLTVDSPIPDTVLGRIVESIQARDARFIDLEGE